jgi:TRAP-type C4-dicarboxylate transport system permease small subunit
MLLVVVRAANRAVDALARFMGACAGWLIVACALFITFDVLARRFLGFSTQSSVELSGYMLGIGIAWGLASAMEARAHVRIDVLIMRVRPGLRRWLHWVALLALAVFAGFLLYGAWYTTKESWDFRATDNSLLKTPLIIPQGLWLTGLGVFGLMVALRVVEVTLLLGRGSIDEVERLTGPRSFVEEAEETLDALGIEQGGPAPAGASVGGGPARGGARESKGGGA